jgi:hypothetical protein
VLRMEGIEERLLGLQATMDMEEKVECRHKFLLKKNLSLMEGIEERLLWAPATIAWKKGLNVAINFY